MAVADSIPELKPIPGFRGYYASRDGWIWSTWRRSGLPGRRVLCIPDAKPAKRMACPIVSHKDGARYRHVILRDAGKTVWQGPIHRLILLTFIGPAPRDKPHGAHENGDSLDNRLENLAWKSAKENQHDRYRHGTIGHLRGEQVNHKLTAAQVIEIRCRYEMEGIPQWKLAEEFRVHQGTISEIVRRKIWTHI